MTFLRTRPFAQLTATLLAAMLAIPAAAAPGDTTSSTGVSGQSQSSFATDLSLAKQGNAEAQFLIGARYFFGEVDGIQQDYDQAKKWLEQAAKQGYANSQYALAVMYAQGLGVKQDYDQARTLLEQAAAQGHTYAQEALNDMRRQGLIR